MELFPQDGCSKRFAALALQQIVTCGQERSCRYLGPDGSVRRKVAPRKEWRRERQRIGAGDWRALTIIGHDLFSLV